MAVIHRLYPESPPKALALIEAAHHVKLGEQADQWAKRVGSTRRRITELADSADPVHRVLQCTLVDAAGDAMRRPEAMLGQLLLGEIAERAFADIYRTTMGTDDLRLEDDRSSRNETDYRVLNGQNRPVFRINIKFHGTPFRKAAELVGLQPEDCFALATYKIYQGLQKHETERLPYVFVIVGVPGLTGAAVGNSIPEDLKHVVSLVHAGKGVSGKRGIEERVIAYLLDTDPGEPFQSALRTFQDRIRSAAWYALSARKADKLLREKLFQRVYGVRVRAFARNYGNAELDMHFSLAEDLTPLMDFLQSARERGLHGLAVDLERGVM